MIVCKFGGTSVQDAPAIQRLVDIVRRCTQCQPLIVVSALARVTDGLLHLARLVETGESTALERTVADLLQRHRAVASALPGGSDAISAIDDEGTALQAWLQSALGRSLTPRELDALVGHGELWSSRIVAAALAGSGIKSEWVDVRPIMLTDERFTRATPQVDELRARARACLPALLAAGSVPVTQGFLGATAGGVPTTLGRGGSDFTASLLGAALGAERVEIWTDVDGLMTADPRIVPSARTLAVATYEEAAELATFGAKVLHPATQLPLAQEEIPIVILNSNRPEHPGTTIRPTAGPEHVGDSPIRSISWKKGITVINIRAPRMLGAFGFLRALFEVFERHEVVVDVLASGEVSISLTIEDRTHLDVLTRDLSALGEVWVDDGRAIIAIVGIGLRTTPGVAARVFSAIRPTNVEIISQGGSAINMTFVVREEDGPDAVRRLHREFFGTC